MIFASRLFSLVGALLVLSFASAQAESGMADSTAPVSAQTPPYIAAWVLPPKLLVPPPDENSAGWRDQVAKILDTQKDISADELTEMRDEQHLRLDLLTGIIGKDFTPQRFPKTFALLDKVMQETGDITRADKNFWHTRRPYLADKRVKLLIDPLDDNPSYPSGHTSETRVVAEILGLLYPDKVAALRARAMEIAWHRVEAGVHYPVDIEGGNTLAMLIMGALMENGDFTSDLGAARQEITQLPGPTGSPEGSTESRQ